MKVYNFKKINTCYTCGNIDRNIEKFIEEITSKLSNYKKEVHPKELERMERLKNKSNVLMSNPNNQRRAKKSAFKPNFSPSGYNDSVIIVSGNCGIGGKKMSYYEGLFEKLNNILANNNCFILFVRGNNDDPQIFNECRIDFEHVKTIPDYSVVCLKHYNCLCIGGSTSLDKEWKLAQESNFGKKLFWENEMPSFDEDELTNILNKYKISCVVSSTSPSFTFPSTNTFNSIKWAKDNSEIKNNLLNERKTLDRIYNAFVENNVKPYVWIYGRFKKKNTRKINDIVFDSLQPFQIENVNNAISFNFGISLSKKLEENTFALDDFYCGGVKKKMAYNPPHPYLDDEEMVNDNLFEEETHGRQNDLPRFEVPQARIENANINRAFEHLWEDYTAPQLDLGTIAAVSSATISTTTLV